MAHYLNLPEENPLETPPSETASIPLPKAAEPLSQLASDSKASPAYTASLSLDSLYCVASQAAEKTVSVSSVSTLLDSFNDGAQSPASTLFKPTLKKGLCLEQAETPPVKTTVTTTEDVLALQSENAVQPSKRIPAPRFAKKKARSQPGKAQPSKDQAIERLSSVLRADRKQAGTQ